jgi:cysteinyl-tRNA synthetase
MWHGYVLRLAMLMTQYRQPIDWTVDRLVQSRSALRDWIDIAIGADSSEIPSELIAVLSDDINTPEAISVLHGLHRDARRADVRAAKGLNAALRFLGIWNGEQSAVISSYGYEVTSGPVTQPEKQRTSRKPTASAMS